MKKITKSDLKGLAETFPVCSEDTMRKVVGGVTINEVESFLTSYFGYIGYGFSDSWGNYAWFRSYDAFYDAFYYCQANDLPIGSNVSQFYLSNGYGGYDHCYALHDGYLYETKDGIVVCGSNGNSILLAGVKFGTWLIEGYGFQVGGTIRLGGSRGFTVADVVHEYGHYLQQQSMSNFKYFTDVAVPSLISVITDPDNHHKQPYEQDATERGNAYYKQNVYSDSSQIFSSELMY
ncbi:MAG: hypothetical protein LBL94_05425 [Prevotellaceae bacterium]|jgi:hypothetical protein|nr:hypothetical protein [Prevotellaceae bacterium]